MHTTHELRGTFTKPDGNEFESTIVDVHVSVIEGEVHFGVDASDDEPSVDMVLTEHDLNVIMALCQLAFRKAQPGPPPMAANPSAQVLS